MRVAQIHMAEAEQHHDEEEVPLDFLQPRLNRH